MYRILLSLVLMFTSMIVLAQTNVFHIVQRGETIESVANKYGVTVADIKEANPDTKEYFFVGMKLVIPKVVKQVSQTQQTSQDARNINVNETFLDGASEKNSVQNIESSTHGFKYVLSGDDGSFEKKTYNVCADLACVLGTKQQGYTGMPWSMLASVGVNFRITAPFYVGARLGYMCSISDYTLITYPSLRSEATTHSLVLPLEIGYSISLQNKKFAISPLLGIMPSVSICGKSKYNGVETHLDAGKLGMACNAGLRVRLMDFSLSAQIILQKYEAMPGASSKIHGSPSFSLGWGF